MVDLNPIFMKPDMQISFENHTKHFELAEFAKEVVDIYSPKTFILKDEAGLSDYEIKIRITDTFEADVEASHPQRYQKYTTKRAGGSVSAITLKRDIEQGILVVLINSANFVDDLGLASLRLPITIAHEIAHCLIGFSRMQHGFPEGYVSDPRDLIEGLSYIAVSVCDEFLADAIAEHHFPPISLRVEAGGHSVPINPEKLFAEQIVNSMYNELDTHVYPAWRNSVQEYRVRLKALEEMIYPLCIAVQEGLILSAHYRAATMGHDRSFDEIQRVSQHPAMKLYFNPFWDMVGQVLDSRIDSPFQVFAEKDQEAIDVATEAVKNLWEALGIQFEPTPENSVHISVREPLEHEGS